jgi:hypothetical protein
VSKLQLRNEGLRRATKKPNLFSGQK